MTVAFIFWIVIAIVAAIGEVLTMGLFLAVVALAAVLTAAAGFVLAPVLQVLVFAALSLLGIAVVRPLALRSLGQPALPGHGPTPHAGIVGKRGVVTRTVNRDGGQIRIGEGEFWTARPFDDDEVLLPGTLVDILLVNNLTALVTRAVPVLDVENVEIQQKGQ